MKHSLILTIALAATLHSAEPPLLVEATEQFKAMTTTLYQHKTEVDRTAGSYRYDCVGFVSYALKHAAPQAWASAFKATGIDKGRIPRPPRYRTFFASLADTPQPGWEAVVKIADLRPGDIVAWEHKTATAVGHAVIIGTIPVAAPDGSWLVMVYDSTASPHAEDTRPADERAQPLAPGGRHSGLGHGMMSLIADPATGALTGYRWSPKAKTSTVPIAAGRPLS